MLLIISIISVLFLIDLYGNYFLNDIDLILYHSFHFNVKPEVLFASQGSIKKIKIYSAPDGTKKGDALITYTRAEAASMACIQYNNLNIGEGCIISVMRASFTVSEKSRKEDEAEEKAKDGIKIEVNVFNKCIK
jgi:hypothetical protein